MLGGRSTDFYLNPPIDYIGLYIWVMVYIIYDPPNIAFSKQEHEILEYTPVLFLSTYKPFLAF